jgi:hypothetical protein
MLTKIRLFMQIRKFYKIFGSEVGASFITKLSDMTTDNVYDVLFDINEIREVSDDDAWLDQLQNQLFHFCDKPQTHRWTEAILILVFVATLVVGFITTAESEPVQVVEQVHTRYTAFGRYYTDGTVITDDGNEWAYTTDTISDKTPTDAMPVWIGFDDNGTPTDITDDIVLGLVYDVYTAIYDALEVELSQEFELERDGNHIQIITNEY